MESIIPTLGVFAAAGFRLMPSVNRVLTSIQSLRYALPTTDILRGELKAIPPEPTRGISPGTESERPIPFTHTIELRGVSFSYPGVRQPALRDINVVIQKGTSVGFIGDSGAGKSTLIDVVLGLLSPQHGSILVDGEDIASNLRGWQSQIGYVPQVIYLTDDTLRRNVAFGLAENRIDDQAVRAAITAARLGDFVARLPDGIDTVVGERGVRLSGGQRQRIGIARALYHDPAVLVLDEATSSLDTTTEQGVLQAVNALHGLKTVLVVAHRMSTVAGCDKLCRLQHGRLRPTTHLDRITEDPKVQTGTNT